MIFKLHIMCILKFSFAVIWKENFSLEKYLYETILTVNPQEFLKGKTV